MRTIKVILGLIILIILIVIVIALLQTTGIYTIPFIETIRTDGLFTTVKNLWLENVTPFWNEHIQPILS